MTLPSASDPSSDPAPVPAGDAAVRPSAPDPSPEAASGAPPVDRRARPERRGVERRVASVPVAVERRKGGDRRTQADRREQGKRGGEYDLDADTLEFIAAVNRFKAATGQTFPTWSDLLGIVRDLGYEKRNP